jgi:imidazolonepropionase-like amidohydrolase
MTTSGDAAVPTLYYGARLISGDGSVPVDEAYLVVRDGLVESIGRLAEGEVADVGARRVDLRGRTIMPTIVNPHGHIGYFKDAVADRANYSRENVLDHLRRLAYYGISVFQSLGTDRDDVEIGIRDEQRRGTLADPELALLMTAGTGLVAPTPGGDNGGAMFATDVLHEVSTPEEARTAVRELALKGPDFVKFWVDDRNGTKAKFGPDVYSAIIDEAHENGLRAIAHIYELDDAKGVVRAGVDGIAHMVREPGPDAELLELLTAKDVFVFTSMSIQKGLPDGPGWLDDPALAETVTPESINVIRRQINSAPDAVVTMMTDSYRVLETGLLKYVDAGVRVLLSADTGLFTQFVGFAEHRELEAMVSAGMPALDAITAATLLPARMLGLSDRGSLEPGKRADFIVLDADPLDDIVHTRRIAAVVIGGVELDRAAMRARWTGAEVPAH